MSTRKTTYISSTQSTAPAIHTKSSHPTNPAKPSKPYKAILSEKLSRSHDKRFVIIDTATGELLDDAQGYGYKSAQKAYAAYGYKTCSPKKNSQEQKIKAWWKKHKSLRQILEDAEFYAWKDSCGEESLTTKDFKEILESEPKIDIDTLPATPSEMLRVWKRM